MIDKRGYIKDYCSRIKTMQFRHILIWEQYNGLRLDNMKGNGSKYVIDHIDNDKFNNHISNLQVIERTVNVRKEYNRDLPINIYKHNKGYRAAVGRKMIKQSLDLQVCIDALETYLKNN